MGNTANKSAVRTCALNCAVLLIYRSLLGGMNYHHIKTKKGKTYLAFACGIGSFVYNSE